MNDSQPRYKFRWSNVDIESYFESGKARVLTLRRKAADLMLEADIIDREVNTIRNDLIEDTEEME